VVVSPYRPFPADARRLERLMIDTLHNLNEKFPSLKIVYLPEPA
jgi:hypothetical protein